MMELGRNIARNIKRLREEKHVTQEQLATELNITYQAVSKWENGVSFPDILVLPEIAQFFGVTVDELYRDEKKVYTNYASKLLSIYESSHNQDDFIRADAEFRKLIESREYTNDDLRRYGVLYEYHMEYCTKKSLELYDKVITSEAYIKNELYYQVKRQKLQLLSKVGRCEEGILIERKSLQEDPESIDNHICLMAAYYLAKQYELGYQVLQEALSKFHVFNANIYIYGGDICKELQKYEEAFEYWEKSLELDDTHIDGMYSKALCYHELHQYDNEIKTWERIIEWLRDKGYTIQVQFPKDMQKKAKEMMLDNRK